MGEERKAEVVEVQATKEQLPAVKSDPESLIAIAIQNNVNVDSLERLLKMRSEFRAEQARELYYRQLAAFQRVCPSIPKTEKVRNSDGSVRYSYASLDGIVEAVKDQLGAHGFSYRFEVLQQTEAITVMCELIHQSGHKEQTSMTVPIDPKAFMNAQQKVASAITYGKRYTFTNATGILTGDEDDDARGAGDNPKSPAQKPVQTSPAAKPAVPVQKPQKPAAAEPDFPTVQQIEKTQWFNQINEWINNKKIKSADVLASIKMRKYDNWAPMPHDKAKEVYEAMKKLAMPDITENTDFNATPVDPPAGMK